MPLDASNQRQLNCYFDSLCELIKIKAPCWEFLQGIRRWLLSFPHKKSMIEREFLCHHSEQRTKNGTRIPTSNVRTDPCNLQAFSYNSTCSMHFRQIFIYFADLKCRKIPLERIYGLLIQADIRICTLLHLWVFYIFLQR